MAINMGAVCILNTPLLGQLFVNPEDAYQMHQETRSIVAED